MSDDIIPGNGVGSIPPLTLPTGVPRTVNGRALVSKARNSRDELTITRQALIYAVEAIEFEAGEQVRRALAATGLQKALPYIRHRATCLLNAVRDNPPWDESCTCGLREFWLLTASTAAQTTETGQK